MASFNLTGWVANPSLGICRAKIPSETSARLSVYTVLFWPVSSPTTHP
jgi:hypothetical protein